MKAAVVEELGRIRYKEVEEPELLPDSLLLRVKGCAICGSDLSLIHI